MNTNATITENFIKWGDTVPFVFPISGGQVQDLLLSHYGLLNHEYASLRFEPVDFQYRYTSISA